MKRLEKEIDALEVKQAELTAELEKQETYAQPGRAMMVNRELMAAVDDLANLTARWEAAATRLAEMELVE